MDENKNNIITEPVVNDSLENTDDKSDNENGNYTLQAGAFYSKRNAENLKKKKFVVTSEIQPPIGTGAGELVKNVERIRGRVDALTVPDLKIDGLVVDTMGTCRILREQKFDPILQTACRDRNRVELQDYLLKATAAGIENILTFTEDYRITGDSLQEIMYFHVDSGKLFSVVDN
jgi:methylenetetrahydrofolate reductase (NADPH)